MAGFRVEELQRMGWFRCATCGGSEVGVSIYDTGLGYRFQLENWRRDGGAKPRDIDGRHEA